MTRTVSIHDNQTLHEASALAGLHCRFINGLAHPPHLALTDGVRAGYGDTLTLHDDGTVTVAKTVEGGLW